jgi:hypothetical protein
MSPNNSKRSKSHAVYPPSRSLSPLKWGENQRTHSCQGSPATQTPLVVTHGFAENTQSNDPKRIPSEDQPLHTVFETERYSDNYDNLINDKEKTTHRY